MQFDHSGNITVCICNSVNILKGPTRTRHPAHKPTRQTPAKQKASKQRNDKFARAATISTPIYAKHLYRREGRRIFTPASAEQPC